MSSAVARLGRPLPVALELRDFVDRRLAAWAGKPRTVVLSVPAPVAPPERLLSLAPRDFGVLWDPPSGWSITGVGAAHRIELQGDDRFQSLQRDAAAVAARLVLETYPECESPAPRMLGGLAFNVGAARQEPWSEFGDGCFTLPRFTYAVKGEEACLSLALHAESEALTSRDRVAWAERLMTLLEQLAETAPTPESFGGYGVRGVERPSQESWRQQVEAIRTAIAGGRFEKIVAARRSVVELSGAADPAAFLPRLSRGLRASTRFAFCREASTFVGATPERLVRLRGRVLETEALAGSIASGAEQARALLNSSKDLREHQLVVDQIERRLRPLCEALDFPADAQVLELREVLHLHTPISGLLREERHVLELVEVLHPTPGVGGVPAEQAVRWIIDHEPEPRGWYAAPIGWFDAAGNGEFAVALRSCLLRDRWAYLFAGAGIVHDSDPDLEYIETELKKQTLRRALGAC